MVLKTLSTLALGLVVGLFVGAIFWLAYNTSPSHGWVAFVIGDPIDLGVNGGIGPVILNTFMMVLAAVTLAFIPALACSLLYFSISAHHAFGFVLRLFIEISSGMPRVLWGITGAFFFGGVMGLGISALTGILTLSFLLSPIIAVLIIDGIEQQKKRLLFSIRAIGLSNAEAWMHYILPASKPSIYVAIQSAIGRGFGDAAALYLTAGGSLYLLSSLDQPAATIAVNILVLIVEIGGGTEQASAAAVILFSITALMQLPFVLLQNKTKG